MFPPGFWHLPSTRTWGVIIKDVSLAAGVLTYLGGNGTTLGLPHEWGPAMAAAGYVLGQLVRAIGDATDAANGRGSLPPTAG